MSEHDDSALEAAEVSDRRAAVREKALRVSAQQRRSKWAVRTGLTVLALAVVGAAVTAVVMTILPEATKPVSQPENMDGDAVALAPTDDLSSFGQLAAAVSADAAGTQEQSAVRIDIYVDYQSAASAQFQAANAAQLADWVKRQAAEVVYHPVALQTSQSNGTRYSLRAAGAIACVRSLSPEQAPAFNHELLVNAPQPDTSGYTDAELADLAVATGAADADAVRACIEDGTYVSWASATTQQLLGAELPGTDGVELKAAPTVLVDGRPYTGSAESSAEFAQFALTVSSHNYYETDEPTPPPSN